MYPFLIGWISNGLCDWTFNYVFNVIMFFNYVSNFKFRVFCYSLTGLRIARIASKECTLCLLSFVFPAKTTKDFDFDLSPSRRHDS